MGSVGEKATEMMLDWKHKLLLGLLVAGLAGGVLGFRTWLSEHDARLQLAGEKKAAEAVQAQAESQITALAKQMADRDSIYQNQLKSLEARFADATTPQQVATLATQLVGLRTPIQVVTPAPNASDPHPSPVAQVPQIDFPQAKAYLQECEQCKLDRAKLQADAADRAAQAKLAKTQMDSLKKENGDLQTALKGGSWWLRTKRAAKWLVVGGVAGGVALCGTGHCKL
jgi:hypothetical protein